MSVTGLPSPHRPEASSELLPNPNDLSRVPPLPGKGRGVLRAVLLPSNPAIPKGPASLISAGRTEEALQVLLKTGHSVCLGQGPGNPDFKKISPGDSAVHQV